MEIPPELLEQIKQNKGEAIGAGPKGNFEFVLINKGEKEVQKLEQTLAKFGCPLKYKELKRFGWYPEVCNLILLELIRISFNWDKEKIKEMGRFEARTSFITKLMMKYFVSPQKVLKMVGKYWHKYHTRGELKAEEFSREERYAILTLENFPGSPAPLFLFRRLFLADCLLFGAERKFKNSGG
jgi:hypothetical protein